MTHTEFKLIANRDIIEQSRGIETIAFHKGETVIINEDKFNRLQKNETLTQYTQHGIISYDKYAFENEVQYTAVTVEYGTRKLGQRASKVDKLQAEITENLEDLKVLYLHAREAYPGVNFKNWCVEVHQEYQQYHNIRVNPRTFNQWINGQIIALT